MKHMVPWFVGLTIFLGTVMILAKLGWVEAAALFDMGANLLGLITLLAMIKLPWDLYFEARNLITEQDEALTRGKELSTQQRRDVRALARRLLLGCIALHLGSGIVIAAYTYFSDGRLGYYYAGFFALSMAFRPLASYYKYQMARLRALRGQLHFPRDDVDALKERVELLEFKLPEQQQSVQRIEALQQQLENTLGRRVEALEHLTTQQTRDFHEKVDRVCREFGRSIEQLTEDKEVLRGIKAFVRMVKSS